MAIPEETMSLPEKNRTTLVKVCIGDWKNASRDQRELEVCRGLGAKIVVVAKGGARDKGRKEDVSGFMVHRLSTRPLRNTPVKINLIVSIIQWAMYIRKLRPQIISGHDLPGLTIGWLSTLGIPKKEKPKLIYDSHEFELGHVLNRGRFKTLIIKWWEHFMINNSVFTIVVNESIADEIIRIHHLDKRPVVARNMPYRWNIEEDICERKKQEILNAMTAGVHFLLVYCGMIMNRRGIDRCIELLTYDHSLGLLVLGDSSGDYINDLKKHAKSLRVESRVYFHKAVSHSELWKYIGASDLSLIIPDVSGNRSYYLSLPNKFFESIQAYTPVLSLNLPEIRFLIEKYDIGIIVKEDKVDCIAEEIAKYKSDQSLQKRLIENTKKAASELCWETEAKQLEQAYGKIIKNQDE